MKAIRHMAENWMIGRYNAPVYEELGILVALTVLILPVLLLSELLLPEEYSAWRVFTGVIVVFTIYCIVIVPFLKGRQLRKRLDPVVFDKIRRYAVK